MADLEANFMHLQLLHESLGRFNENFGAFLYGMNMSAFCVDFPEAPIPQSFARSRDSQAGSFASPMKTPADTEATFLTNDTSFVENPPTSGKPASKYATPKAARDRQTMGPGRGGAARGRGAGTSGIARSTSTRGGAAAGASRGASGIGRGVPRGRGVVR
jgi:DASH complex subunit DAM1